MIRVRAWLRAARPLAQVNIALPLLVGELLAWREHGRIDVALVVLVHIMGVLDHVFIVFANDVADEPGDRLNDTFNVFSGGSRVLPEGRLTRAALVRGSRIVAATLLALAAATGVAFDRPGLALGWIAAIGLLWAYSYPPLRLSYRGFGAIAQAVGVGVILPWLGYYAQVGETSGFPWPVWIPLALLGLAGNLATALPDTPADLAVDKRAWPVAVGPVRARKHTLQLLAAAILCTPLVLEAASQTVWALVEAGPLVALAAAAWTWRSADARERTACRRFVVLCGIAGHGVTVAWVVAIALGHG